MKKALIISTYYTTDLSVGSERVRLLTNHLRESGWNVTLLVPQSNSGIVIPNGLNIENYFDHYRIIKWFKARRRQDVNSPASASASASARRVIKNYVCSPDPFVFWLIPSFFRLLYLKFIKNKSYDLIISSSNPKTPHLIAYVAKFFWGAPWIMEYRDFWTIDHYYEKFGMVAQWESWLEKKVTSKASLIVTISPEYTERMRSFSGKDVYTIYNAYDNELVNSKPDVFFNKFTITYTGNLAGTKRDPSLLFQAISELVAEGLMDPNKIDLVFIGKDSTSIHSNKHASSLLPSIKSLPYLKREDVLNFQRKSHLLLMIFWDHPLEVGVVTGKFEYFASLRPILAINGQPKGVMKRILEETLSGSYFTKEDIVKLKQELLMHYANYINRNLTSFVNDITNIYMLSSESQKKEYLNLVDKLVG